MTQHNTTTQTIMTSHMENARSALPFLKSSTNKYDVVYINTPWSKLGVDTISKFPINDMVNKDALVFLWVDSYNVPNASKLVEKWGLDFHSVFQVADYAKYNWMSTPTAPVVCTKEAVKGEEEEMTDETKEEVKGEETKETGNAKGGETKEAAKVGKKRNNRVPPIVNPTWWSSASEPHLGSRPTTEQLWMLSKGDPSSILASKTNTTQSHVVNLPDVGKKSRAKKKEIFGEEWNTERPHEFMDIMLSLVGNSKRVLNAFGTNTKDKVDSWGPGVPGGFLGPTSSSSGLVGAINQVMRVMKKSQLHTLYSKFAKFHLETDEDKRKTLDDMGTTWKEMETALSSTFDIPYSWKDDNGIVADWTASLVSLLATYNISKFSNLRTKKKKRKVSTSNAPRHGIASAGRITPELADFFGMGHDDKIARTSAVSKLNEYIVEKKLQNPDNRLQILLDGPLEALLRPPADFGPVTYFNLCKLVGIHFPPKTAEEKKMDADAHLKRKEEGECSEEKKQKI